MQSYLLTRSHAHNQIKAKLVSSVGRALPGIAEVMGSIPVQG